jgi:hypothetical protein
MRSVPKADRAARYGPSLAELKAPVQMEDGSVVPRTAGTPQGGVVSPILANLFLHYASVAKVVTLLDAKKQFEEQGTEGASTTQAEMAKLLREEYTCLGALAKSIGVGVD